MTPTVSATPVPTVAPSIAVALRAAGQRLGEAGIATPRQDAEALLARVLGRTRLGLHMTGRAALSDAAWATFEALVARRARHEPVQYLLGEAEFCGVVLELGPGVFIPRPETEGLVERAMTLGPPASATVLDLCTGSGAIACALGHRRPGWTVWAVEQARPATDCARANVRRLGLDGRVHVLEGDLFEPLRGRLGRGAADLVVANPPYLAVPLLPALPVEVRDWEPRAALDGGADGLDVIRRLLGEAPDWLCPGGGLLIEIGEEQGSAARGLVRANGRYGEALVHRDFRGCERVLEARRR
jgi:release factor glutamine methyltransferase